MGPQVSKVCGIRPSDARAIRVVTNGSEAPRSRCRSLLVVASALSALRVYHLPLATSIFSFVFLVRDVLSFFQRSLLILRLPRGRWLSHLSDKVVLLSFYEMYQIFSALRILGIVWTFVLVRLSISNLGLCRELTAR